MAWTVDQLNSLESAIASGTLRVSYGGKSSEFRSLDEMLRVRAIMRRALGFDPTRGATFFVAHDKGIGGAPLQGDTFFSGYWY